MAIELRFSKPDPSSHWGFRLVGGSDFNEPLVVVKVNENSIAENSGLMVGDVVVRVNDDATAGLTHTEAHDLINEAGCDFIMAIRRGLFSDIPVPCEEDVNAEVENIIKESLAEQFEDTDKDQEIGPESKILENLAGQEQLIDSRASISEKTTKNKKYSTFLVKPRNPKPVSKQAEEDRKKLGDPYRVKIVKQPRRDPKDVLNRKKTVQFEPNVIEVEISRDTSVADSNESFDSSEANIENDMEMEVETSVQISEETTVEICEEENGAISPATDSSTIEEDEAKLTIRRPVAVPLDIHIEPVICESSLSLEQQLAAVQKQLLALSQLPSAIQVTLEAVTQQLNKIVLEKSQQQFEENEIEVENINGEIMVNGSEDTIEDDKNPDESQSLSENAEGDITETENEDQANVDELESDPVEVDDNTVEEDVEPEEPVVVDPYAGLTEEEKEAKLREEQLMAKKQKIEEARRKMDWTQRPIVLPGGRKWTDPEDATPKPKTTKMSDEKICKTLDDYSEVIVGKTKGINFLKYQPPPKNLDYLQRSEVYRLIHDMEPPVKGVGARAEKILSEKDYLGDKGAP
ncbi:unnamed protein product [Ceutorhynchus assimilis]|uniref:PDZ domain-containing protein n=1 Tax=Ceutorhynchus assimilis TaxID=467358 RepID=A0A9N9MWR8_9CUCU|nr:unnamed protein product [Ceutorhynchus assimilis]